LVFLFFGASIVAVTAGSPSGMTSCATDNGQSCTSNESASFDAPASGCTPCEFFVVVQGFDGDENDYEIRVEGSN